jgi:hypothetical protein
LVIGYIYTWILARWFEFVVLEEVRKGGVPDAISLAKPIQRFMKLANVVRAIRIFKANNLFTSRKTR